MTHKGYKFNICALSFQKLEAHVDTERKNPHIFYSIKRVGFFVIIILLVSFLSEADLTNQGSGAEVCLQCHDNMMESFKINPHAKFNNKEQVENVCIFCHGNANRHLDEGGGGGNIFAFLENDKPEDKLKKCLECHKKTGKVFQESLHGQEALDCTICHFIHQEEAQPSLLETENDALCVKCHEVEPAHIKKDNLQKASSDKITCKTCHNPHSQKIKK